MRKIIHKISDKTSCYAQQLPLSVAYIININGNKTTKLIPAEGEDEVIKYHDWNTFQKKLDATEEQKAERLAVPKYIYSYIISCINVLICLGYIL
jgi:hypothetical protein